MIEHPDGSWCIDPELWAECVAAGLLDPIDPDPPSLHDLLEDLRIALLRVIAPYN